MTHDAQADQDFISAALPVFIGEAHEQIETFEQLLLQLEHEPANRELLDALFRAAHTVKGSAGIFGLDGVVAFTHHVESLLDRLRDGRVAFDAGLGTLLLRCNDEIRALVDATSAALDDGDGRGEARAELISRLQAAGGGTANVPAQPQAARAPASRNWIIGADFGVDTFRNGMDPLAIFSYLEKLGRIDRVVHDSQAIPGLHELDPESCHLGFELSLASDAQRDQIESAFSFVRDDCRLHLVEPGATPGELARLIQSMPNKPRLGEILVSVGAITLAQLQQALDAQHSAAPAEGQVPRLGEVLQRTAGISAQVVKAALDRQGQGRTAGAAPAAMPAAHEEQRFIRVHADRLDAVINLLGELVIASAGASMLASQTRQRALAKANQQVGRLIEEIRNSTLQLRMVPIGETFSRFRRVVRDTAAELGKDVALEIVGADTELDKSVVERIADPLMHLVRNALDHGLEPPDERVAAGKPPQGRLLLSACHEAGSILLRIQDDGRGIRRDKVLERARERGLVAADAAPAEAEIDRLIFEPGFSTAEKVTNLSGRGVGMDVVRRNIETLRGSVEVSSTPGAGCCMQIRLPLTLAIIDGFLVGVGGSKFIFPLDAVVEVIENRPGPRDGGGTPAGADAAGRQGQRYRSEPDARGRSVVELRGQVLPVLSLRHLYALGGTPSERSSVVVLQAGAQRFGVVVDQLLGQHQTVIKPLGRLFRSLRGMSGSSILGNGEVALIFDAAALCQAASGQSGTRFHSSRSEPGRAGAEPNTLSPSEGTAP